MVAAGGSDLHTNRPAAAQSESAQQSDEAAAGAALRGAMYRVGQILHVPISACPANTGPHK